MTVVRILKSNLDLNETVYETHLYV